MNISLPRNSVTSGFSFIELVMYILIIGILAGGATIGYLTWVNKAKVSTTETNLRVIKNSLDIYHTQESKYPDKLNELVKSKLIQKVPQDGWKQDFRYKVTPGAKQPYELYSFGPNGPQGTKEERINIWDL